MIVEVKPAEFNQSVDVIRNSNGDYAEQYQTLQRCFFYSPKCWIGFADGRAVCTWGLAPPSLLSTRAFIWLFVDEARVKEHQFLFVRWSKRQVECMLEEFDEIEGFCFAGHDKSIRWLKWLGAEFDFPQRDRIPFVIRKEKKWQRLSQQ